MPDAMQHQQDAQGGREGFFGALPMQLSFLLLFVMSSSWFHGQVASVQWFHEYYQTPPQLSMVITVQLVEKNYTKSSNKKDQKTIQEDLSLPPLFLCCWHGCSNNLGCNQHTTWEGENWITQGAILSTNIMAMQLQEEGINIALPWEGLCDHPLTAACSTPWHSYPSGGMLVRIVPRLRGRQAVFPTS